MLNTVLLPTDLSAAQELMMRFAVGLPDLGVRTVVCCHVVDATGLEGPVITAKVESAREQLTSATADLVAAGLKVDLRVTTGDPEEELLSTLAGGEFDGLLCGTSGKATTAGRLFVGSVSERLIRDGGVPSLTVRYDLMRNASDPADLARQFGRVLLVPTDFSGTAARAFDLALSLPRKMLGNVRVFHVLADGAGDGEAEERLRKLVGIAKERGVTATPVLGHGSPERAILREVEGFRVSGIVVGSRGRSVIQEALMGSVSMTLMRQAPCPVLIVP
jgi:nucleotide-binding universal stress UspA family protein